MLNRAGIRIDTNSVESNAMETIGFGLLSILLNTFTAHERILTQAKPEVYLWSKIITKYILKVGN